MAVYCNLVVEDVLHENSLRKILTTTNPDLSVHRVFGKRGFGYVKEQLPAFNEASKFSPYLILTDLDKHDCPKIMRDEWVSFAPHPNFIFRIAVREVEAWLLADRHNFADYFGISKASIPLEPESISDPKEFIIRISKKSKHRTIREDVIPIGSASVGPRYNECVSLFIKWNVAHATAHSESLRRLILRLQTFKPVFAS